jgi:hypothetical protein
MISGLLLLIACHAAARNPREPSGDRSTGRGEDRFIEPGAGRRACRLLCGRGECLDPNLFVACRHAAIPPTNRTLNTETETGDGRKWDLMRVRDLDSCGVEIGRVMQTAVG